MTIEAALVKFLTADPAAAAVQALIAGRMYPKRLPQKPTLPAIVYNRESGPRTMSHDGDSGLAHPLIMLDMYAKTYQQAKDLSEAVRLALNGFKGTMGAGGAEPGVVVDGAFLEDDGDGYDDDLKQYWFHGDYEIWHNETITG